MADAHIESVGIGEVLRRSCSRLCLIAVVFISALQFVRKARELFFALAGRDSGLSDEAIGRITSLSFLLDMGGFPVAGRVMDRYGRRVAGALSISLQTLGLLLLVWRTPLTTGISGCVTGLGNGLSAGLVMTLGSDFSPEGPARGPFLAVYRAGCNVMEFLAPAVLGWIAGSTSLAVAESFACMVGLFGLSWVLGIMPETRPGSAKTEAAVLAPPVAVLGRDHA